MGDFTFQVARYIGASGGVAFGKPVRAIAAHPIAAAERIMPARVTMNEETPIFVTHQPCQAPM